MALADLLNLSNKNKKIGLSEERVRAIIPAARQYIAFWREYPDIFVDFLQTGGDLTRKKELNSSSIKEYSCGRLCVINMYTWYSRVLILSLSYLSWY